MSSLPYLPYALTCLPGWSIPWSCWAQKWVWLAGTFQFVSITLFKNGCNIPFFHQGLWLTAMTFQIWKAAEWLHQPITSSLSHASYLVTQTCVSSSSSSELKLDLLPWWEGFCCPNLCLEVQGLDIYDTTCPIFEV